MLDSFSCITSRTVDQRYTKLHFRLHSSSFSYCLKSAQKCLIFEFSLLTQFWHFPLILVLLKLTRLATLFDRKL